MEAGGAHQVAERHPAFRAVTGLARVVVSWPRSRFLRPGALEAVHVRAGLERERRRAVRSNEPLQELVRSSVGAKGSMKSSSVPSARMTAVVRLPVHRSSRRHAPNWRITASPFEIRG